MSAKVSRKWFGEWTKRRNELMLGSYYSAKMKEGSI